MRATIILCVLATLFALVSGTVLNTRDDRDHDRGHEPPTAADRHHHPHPSPTVGLGKRAAVEQLPLVPTKDAKVVDFSALLCPDGLTACPLVRPGALTPTVPTTLESWHASGYECVDAASDLGSCGGCASLVNRRDCTTIANAMAVSCSAGACQVHTCKKGYVPDIGGQGCIKQVGARKK